MMRCPATRRLLNLSACFALVLIVASSGLAQALEPEPSNNAVKVDEFERLRGCDFGARLDNFAIRLQQDPGLVGYVVSYGPEGKGSGTVDTNFQVIEDYLVNSRGIEKERLRTVYGGRYKELTELATELWLVPRGGESPKPKEYENTLHSFTGKFIEYEVSDHWAEAEEGSGPYSGDPTLANFADALRQQPRTRAYIVAYSSRAAATGTWRRIAKNIADNLENSYGVRGDRIKIIFAGYDKSKKSKSPDEGNEDARVQLWILPDDAPPPAKEAKAERRPKDLVQIGTFNQYLLKYPDNVKRIFEGFADVLSADEQLRACVIYRLSTEPPDPEAGADEPPDVDLSQLVEKWKADLAKRYKIDEGRLVIIAAAATGERNAGTLETWIVPPGAMLPDPYPPQAEDTGEVEEETPQSF